MHVTSRCQGLFPAPPIFWGKSPGDEVAKTKLVSSPIMDNSVVPLYQFWLHDSGKDQTETTSSWLKFWKLNPEKLTLNPRSIRFPGGNFMSPKFLRFPVYNTRNFHTICFKSFSRKFWRKDIAGEFVLCYRELFFLSGNQATASTRGSTSDFASKMKLHHPHLLYWAWLMFVSGDRVSKSKFQ